MRIASECLFKVIKYFKRNLREIEGEQINYELESFKEFRNTHIFLDLITWFGMGDG